MVIACVIPDSALDCTCTHICTTIARARYHDYVCADGWKEGNGTFYRPTIYILYISSISNFLITNSQLIFLLPSAAITVEKKILAGAPR